jgi:hypothetical protein
MRAKSTAALIADLEKKADNIMEDFSQFTDGTRVLLLLQRAKEGGHNKEHKRRKARFVTHDKEQFRRALLELLILQAVMAPDYRVYLSSAPRDVRKAEMEFKQQMLTVDFSEGENKRFFYEHMDDKWISALMSSNPVKDRGLFILDVDNPAIGLGVAKDIVGNVLKWCAANRVEVVKQYATKNGWHVVTKPFNRTLYPRELGEVKVDGLLLLSY